MRTLGIADVSARTGIGVPVLRAWEARFGFPAPERLPSGRRVYSEREVHLLRQVVRDRAAGLSLRAAIERARDVPQAPPDSVFARVRAGRRDPQAILMPKHALIRMSHAIEDELCARGEAGVLIGTFQRERFYRHAEPRWRDLAKTIELTLALADFDRPRAPRGGPLEVPLAGAAPVRREWAVICDSPRLGACLAGWELPGQRARADAERRFETVWTVEPDVVREATHAAWDIARRSWPRSGALLPAWAAEAAPPGDAALRTLVSLTSRMLAYGEAAPSD